MKRKEEEEKGNYLLISDIELIQRRSIGTLNNTPYLAAMPLPTIIAVGTLRATAHGQETTNTDRANNKLNTPEDIPSLLLLVVGGTEKVRMMKRQDDKAGINESNGLFILTWKQWK